jgi:hypothetical protein
MLENSINRVSVHFWVVLIKWGTKDAAHAKRWCSDPILVLYEMQWTETQINCLLRRSVLSLHLRNAAIVL